MSRRRPRPEGRVTALSRATRRFERMGAPRRKAERLAEKALRVGTLPREQQLAAVWKLGKQLARAAGGRR